jgi:FMN phosphatase YigB (HAD superfamily)
MVGDSWTNDIEGARRAGIAAVWFNPEHLPRPSDEQGVVEIDALRPASDVARVLLDRLS